MKEYTERDDNFYDFEELTSESYLTITSDISGEIANRKDNITTITLQFEDKKRQIKTKKEEISRLKSELRVLTSEKRKIGKHLREEKRTLKVDVNFLNKLNKSMRKPTGKHLVKTKERRVL